MKTLFSSLLTRGGIRILLQSPYYQLPESGTGEISLVILQPAKLLAKVGFWWSRLSEYAYIVNHILLVHTYIGPASWNGLWVPFMFLFYGFFFLLLWNDWILLTDTVCRYSLVKEEMLEVGLELVAAQSKARRRIKVQRAWQGRGQGEPRMEKHSVGWNWDAECELEQGRRERSELRLEK